MGTLEATCIHLVAAKERYATALRGTPPPDDAVHETTTTDLRQVARRVKALGEWFSEYARGPIEAERIINRRGADGATQQLPIEPPQYSAFNWGNELGRITELGKIG